MVTQIVPNGSRVQARRPLDAFAISDGLARRLRLVAATWLAVVTFGFLTAAAIRGVPRSPARDDWEVYAQLGLLVLVVLGGLIMKAHEGIGAAIVTVAGVGLGSLAALEHHPYRALLVALAFYLPALVHWLIWQRTKPYWEVGLLAVGLVLSLALGGWQAFRTYETYFGPVQPESNLAARPVTLVEWVWSGGATEASITVNARLAQDRESVRLVVSRTPDLEEPIFSAFQAADEMNNRIVSFTVSDLLPATSYWYAVESNGEIDRSRLGRFRTYPSGPSSFTFAFGACATVGSNAIVFERIRELDPLFVLHTGDFHYENIGTNDPALFLAAYDQSLMAPAQAALYESAPTAYMWDDHDYGSNNGDSTSPSREAAWAAYRTAVPHYPLASDEQGPIYQAFTVGRVRFILTDGRSSKTPAKAADDASKSMLGAEQKAWFKNELLAAKGVYPIVVWVNAVPWIAASEAGADTWAGYTTERREIANFIAYNDIRGLVMLSGDAHMLAIDDGSNSDYSTDGGAGFPVFHAGALDRHGSAKGGPYSEGSYPGGGQFGVMTVNDNGGSLIEVVWSGRNYEGGEIVSYAFTVAAKPVEPRMVSTTEATSVSFSKVITISSLTTAWGRPMPLLPELSPRGIWRNRRARATSKQMRCRRQPKSGNDPYPATILTQHQWATLSCP